MTTQAAQAPAPAQFTGSPLTYVQERLHVPKTKYNSFAKYNYRTAEDILDAAKKIANTIGYSVTLTDEVKLIGDRYYVESTATLTNGDKSYSSKSSAREDKEKKGMDSPQVTATTTSYARKLALGGLFAVDDTKDSDDPAMQKGRGKNRGQVNEPGERPTVPPEPTPAVLRTKLGQVLRKYEQTPAAKQKPGLSILLDTMTKNNMKTLDDIAKCEDGAVLTLLISLLEQQLNQAKGAPRAA